MLCNYLSQDRFSRFLDNQLPEPEAAIVSGHLAGCASCSAAFDEQLAPLVHALQTYRPEATLADPSADLERGMAAIKERLPVHDSLSTQGEETLPSGKQPVQPAMPADCSFLQPAQAPDEIGRLGKYRILEEIGIGGMGIVFKAHDLKLDRYLAVKVMKPERAKSISLRNRFLREARAAAKLEHDHVVPIWESDEDQGVLYIAMPLLQGENLGKRLARSGALPLDLVYQVGIETADGLAAAHTRGLIHRDIKPANLWLERRGPAAQQTHETEKDLKSLDPAYSPAPTPFRVRILDFGLAGLEENTEGLTGTNDVLGSPHYMSLEQAEGEQLDARTDIYSLGCVLYETATGKRVIPDGNYPALMRAIRKDTPAAPHEVNPQVPLALSNFIMRLLAKDAAARPATAMEVARTLRALRAGENHLQPAASPARAERPPPAQPQTTGRRPYRFFVAAGWAAAMLLLGVIIIIRIQQPGDPEKIVRIHSPGNGKVTFEILPEGPDKKVLQTPAKTPPPAPPVVVPVEMLSSRRIGDGTAGLALADNDQAGYGVAEIGDVDGDGAPDVALGAIGDSTTAKDAGAVHILFRKADGSFKKSTKITPGLAGIKAEAGSFFGFALAAIGDLDGDGVPDLVVGAQGGGSLGAVYVVFLNKDGGVKASKRLGKLENDLPIKNHDAFGISVASLGDLHQDGGRVLAVGASNSDEQRGCVYLLTISKAGVLRSYRRMGHGADGLRLSPGDRFGCSVAFLGPLKKDESPVLLIGAFAAEGNAGRGAVHVARLQKDGGLGFTRMDDGGFLSDLPKGSIFGYSLAAVGDINADGIPDVAVGARDVPTLEGVRGVIYLLNLNEDGSIQGRTRIGHDSHSFPPGKDVEFGSSIARLSWPRDQHLHLAVGGGPEWLGGRHRGSIYLLDLEIGKR